MCLSVGLAGYAYGSDYAIDSARSCDRRSESMGEVDTACEELRDHAIILIVYTVRKEAILNNYTLYLHVFIGTVWNIRSTC